MLSTCNQRSSSGASRTQRWVIPPKTLSCSATRAGWWVGPPHQHPHRQLQGVPLPAVSGGPQDGRGASCLSCCSSPLSSHSTRKWCALGDAQRVKGCRRERGCPATAAAARRRCCSMVSSGVALVVIPLTHGWWCTASGTCWNTMCIAAGHTRTSRALTPFTGRCTHQPHRAPMPAAASACAPVLPHWLWRLHHLLPPLCMLHCVLRRALLFK